MIKMLSSSGNMCPIMVCDGCGKRIEDSEMALAKFSSDGQDVIICHKMECDDMTGHTKYPDKWGWEQLNYFMDYLKNNTTMGKKVTWR